MFSTLLLLSLTACVSASHGHAPNSTFYNPIFPGFYPDPSCIYAPEWDHTFFCASSSFNAFPGIPIHASKDLKNWKLIGHVLNRKEQLPRLAETNRSTSGIWAPALRFHDDTFWLVTTLVDDDRPKEDSSRWDNIIFKGKDPYNGKSWSNAVHFNFTGYGTEPFWDEDGKVYITGAHAWQIGPYIQQAEANLETGETGEWRIIWNGTGGMAPEGPHIYRKDGWYYLPAAEGGTGLGHMVTTARSKSISGPYESNPANPVLTNANTTSYFQTVGHHDLFHDRNGNWWAVALSTRSGPEYLHYPMGRETVMTAVSWPKGKWPTFTSISGKMSGWPMPPETRDIRGIGYPLGQRQHPRNPHLHPQIHSPAHLTHWRFPIPSSYTVCPPEKPYTLRLTPSTLNLTALNGNYAGPGGQTFISRRQQHTLFTFTVDLDFTPSRFEEEAGVTAFLTQNHHLDLGIVLLPRGSATTTTTTTTLPGGQQKQNPDEEEEQADPDELVPHVRFKGESYVPVPKSVVVPVPEGWRGGKLMLEIRACNATHYAFSVGPAGRRSLMQRVLEVSNEPVSWGFTGTLLGIYVTSNGRNGTTPAYFLNWRYVPQEQFRD
ncbi:Non-reducing end alpha-L-arabinofuranosidase BoGH43B [Achaetomium macrosporum]|uniref:Non-reducing end alpha-L-arabinofuranosidase BoGH43B n=1 Tax=Achaetomium macrosporum TaxID=79813 RepID=A0AAN7HH39_9PEZI|nr:Non-reducing end alpha-L-arabinofuranosidase BoGH43B [Achaetomium macrosporum]